MSPDPITLARERFLALAATAFDQACPSVPQVPMPVMGRMGLPAPVGTLLVALKEVMTDQPVEALAEHLHRLHRGLAPPAHPLPVARPRPPSR